MGIPVSGLRKKEWGRSSATRNDAAVTGFEPLKLKADIITSSADSPNHRHIAAVRGAKADPFVITGPGEYEVNQIFIDGYQDHARQQHGNTVFMIEMNGIFVAHLGKLDYLPTMSEIESFYSDRKSVV